MSDIAVPGYPVEQEDLEALALAAGDIGLPPVGQDSYNFNAYEADSVTARRWQTQLRRIFWDVFDKAQALTALSETTPFDPAAGVVSGPWMIPPSHSLFYFGASPCFTVWQTSAPNYGRTAKEVKLWSRGAATPFSVIGFINAEFDFMLDAGEASYPGRDETSGSLTITYSRSVITTGFLHLHITGTGDTEAEARSACDVTVTPTPTDVLIDEFTIDGGGPYTATRSYRVGFGDCLNPLPGGSTDEFDLDSGVEGDTFTVSFDVTGGGVATFPASGGTGPSSWAFKCYAPYGDSLTYPAAQKPALSEDDWYVVEETPALMVTSPLRKEFTTGDIWNYSNVAFLYAEPLPTASPAPEAWWEAKLWPVAYRTRSRIVNPATGEGDGPTFLGQTHAAGGQTIAVIEAASDGLWCQPSDIAEWEMDGTTRRQPVASLIGGTEACPVFIDWVWVRRKAGVALNTDVEVEIGCWQGEGEAREFVTQTTVTLESGLAAKKCTLAKILPVFDNQSIGYTQADKVTVRCANWKAIGETDGLRNIGRILPDGTPAGIVTDTQRLIEAIAAL